MGTKTPVVAAFTGSVIKKNYGTQTRIGRGIPEIGDMLKTDCPCQRSKTIVFCRACGYHCNGRLSVPCEVHPRVTFLFDISKCGRCHSAVYLDEYRKYKFTV